MISTEHLSGEALINKARDLSSNSIDQIAKACGFVGPGGRVLKKAFLKALVQAKGFATPEVDSDGFRGRHAKYRTRVHGNGNLLVGHAYTKKLGLEPGQECSIELHEETGTIWLRPINSEGTEDSLENSAES